MADPEEQREQSSDKDDGSTSTESSVEGAGEVETYGSPETDTSSEEQPKDPEVAEATIILEDAAEQSESVGTEGKLEDSEGPAEGPPVQEVETASPDAGAPETAEGDRISGVRVLLRKYDRAIGGLVIGVCASFLVYGLWWLAAGPNDEDHKVPTIQVYWASVEGDAPIVDFARFVILLADQDDRAYLLFSVSARPSNNTVYKEINKKMTTCRSAVYGVARKALRETRKEMVTMTELKQYIMDALNRILLTGTVDWIGFTEFVMV